MFKELAKVLEVLHNVPNVHLSGSRYFESKHDLKVYDGADWDLVCDNNQSTIEALKTYGFDELKPFTNKYGDYNSVGILKHKDLNIECCVKYDIYLHLLVFDNMSLDYFKKYIWKSSHVFIGERSEITQRINQLLEYWST